MLEVKRLMPMSFSRFTIGKDFHKTPQDLWGHSQMHVSSKNYEGSGYGLNLDLLTILY